MYNLTLKKPPTTEPLTLTQVKEYLKISDYADTCAGLMIKKSITIEERTPGEENGLPVDVLGFIATVELNVGIIEPMGKLLIKVQESNDQIGWEDWHKFEQLIAGTDKQTLTVNYTGDSRYIRIVGNTKEANATYSANVLLDQGYTLEDSYLSSLITAARIYCEEYQGKAYVTQTWEMSFSSFPCQIEIPKGNLQSIDKIAYMDSKGTVKTLNENIDYIVSTRGILGRVVPAYGKTWPSFIPHPLDAIIIEYTCGYRSHSEIPETIIQAMKLLISHWYSNRQTILIGSISKELEFTISALLGMDRLVNI